MGVVTGLVLYAIIWFMTLFVVLQVGVRTQDDDGERVAGTHGSAPVDPQLGRRFIMTSAIAFGIWAVVAGVIVSGAISISDIDLFTYFGLGSRG